MYNDVLLINSVYILYVTTYNDVRVTYFDCDMLHGRVTDNDIYGTFCARVIRPRHVKWC